MSERKLLVAIVSICQHTVIYTISYSLGWQEWMIVNSSKVIIVLGSVATIESVIISISVIILLGAVCYRCKLNKSTTTGTPV